MKQIVVLGGGISGYGSAILAKKKGFGVFLSDAGRIADRYKAKLDEWEVPYEEGGHTEERILAATEVVKSPGIPDTAPMVRKIREAGIPVISEMEFAGRYMGKAKCICITGSNGKTTTTSLIYKIMRDAGMNVALGGNIGESFAWSVATGDYDWYVLELSSFQLDGMYRFRAHVGVLMNITPDHLDRYDHCFQNYADSKMRIVQNMTSRDWFVYSGDDEVIWNELPKYDLRMRQLPFAAKNAVASGAGDAFLCDGKFTATAGKASVEIDTAKLQIKGLHNAYNAMAAALATLAAGVAPAKIRKSLYAFAPVEHRLEPVAEKDGVLWINDSKATNVDSVYYALESMTRPVVWIAGGTDKGYKNFSSGVGFLLTYDTRDVPANAYRGMYLDFRGMMYQKFLGSDNNFYRLEIDYRQYKTLRKRGVLAWTAQTKNVFGDVPLNKYALSGTPFDLRGYYMGQYRDKSSHVVMAEYRQMINTDKGNWVKRMLNHVGYVAWAGCGFMGPNPGKIEGVLPNMGVGLRIEVQPRMNVRLDLGRNMVNKQNLFYFNMTEAF